MKKQLFLAASFLCSFTATAAIASGWRIPEQSIDSMGKAGANIASASRADAAYYNPAKMGWLADRWQMEMDANYIHLSAVDYNDDRRVSFNHQSDKEDFLIPSAFIASPNFGGMRFGLAFVAPYGLAKHWKNGYGQAFVKKFGLAVFEVNPTVSYTLGEKVGIAAGARIVRASGSVHSDASVIGKELSRDMNGKTTEWGWNAAINVRPTDGLDLAVTYRSYIDLQFADSSSLNLMGKRLTLDSAISIPAPAVLSASAAYDIYDDITVEFTWDRTFWSEYDKFDFDFTPMIPGNPYEPAQVRNWDDSDAFRLGLNYRLNEAVELLAGVGYDRSPTPVSTVDFSVPDSDAWLYSFGVRYKISERMEIGLSTLYDKKENRSRRLNPSEPVYGSFSNVSAFLVTVGVNYTF